MISVFDEKHDLYTVTISKSELLQAFQSEQELQKLFHNIVDNTYGEPLGSELFPLNHGDIHYKLKTKRKDNLI
jgi:hypothetical protein